MTDVERVSKPLPSPVGDDKLPPLPPSATQDAFLPTPPPKIVRDRIHEEARNALPLPPTPTSLSPAFDSLPPTPASPTSMSSSPTSPKKVNPLLDLIDTEKAYVDQLAGVIRKVAAAWSRANLPPPELDLLFRSVEAVYKANRSLLAKLKEIGSNPSSPKALGDLLMRWIDDLEAPYTSYCTTYLTGLDTWSPILTNTRLPVVLATFSAACPPPLSPSSPHPPEPPLWTLDDLFVLPQARIRYYRKLYGRLLKSTAPGRSDHRLLVGALEKLDRLLEMVEGRKGMRPPTGGEDEVVIDLRHQSAQGQQMLSGRNGVNGESAASAASSPRVSSGSASSGYVPKASTVSFDDRNELRLSHETGNTSVGDRASVSTLVMPVADLERRLSTERTVDLFTMKPRAVKLQINPPTLSYTREIRFSGDVEIRFTPRTTGEEVVHRRGHIFLLTDLFLVCERIAGGERGEGGPDMWLVYPPLAGKHLRVGEVEGSEVAVQVVVLKKETLTLYTESRHARDKLLKDMKECQEYASIAPPSSKDLPPPLPPLPAANGFPRSSSSGLPKRSPSGEIPSPHSASPRSSASASPRAMSPRSSEASLDRSMSHLMLSPEQTQHPMYAGQFAPGQVISPTRRGSDGSAFSARAGQGYGPVPPLPPHNQGYGPGPSFGPGQVMPPGPGSIIHPNNYRGPPPGQHFPPPPPPPQHGYPSRPPSEPGYPGPGAAIHRSASQPNFNPGYEVGRAPPVPAMPMPNGYRPGPGGFPPASSSAGSLHAPQPRPLLPSALNARAASMATTGGGSTSPYDEFEFSPPASPVEQKPVYTGPVTSTISAQMKCKVFHKQAHAQWKNLGGAKLKLFHQSPTNVKQLVVEADDKHKTVVISTIVLSDGVERVGRTGVAVELSDNGARTGIVYMLQLRNENSAQGLFDSLLAGSDRVAR